MIKPFKKWRHLLAGIVLAQFLSLPVVAQNPQENEQFDDQEDEDYVNDFMENENESSNKNANLQNNQDANNQEDNFQQENPQQNNTAKKPKPVKPTAAANAGANAKNNAVKQNGNNNFNNNLNNTFNNNFNQNAAPTANQIEVQAQDIGNTQFEQGNFSLQGQGNPAAQGAPGNDTLLNAPGNNPISPEPTNPGADAPATDSSVVSPDNGAAPQHLPDEAGPVVPGVGNANEFAGAPPVFGTRRVMALGEAPEEYDVEPGDTLYDICDQLVDEPDYWPKLWALNPDIKNPHFIYPGVKLTFYPGDTETPPFLQLVTENDVVPVDKGQIQAEELIDRQDLTSLLLNLAKDGAVPIIGPNDLTGADGVENQITIIGGTIRPDKVQVTVPAFLYEGRRDPIGTVVGGVAGSMLIDKIDDVIVRNNNGLNTGTTYTVLRESEDVYNVETSRYVGKRYEFVAHIRVTERANGENLFLAKVTENRLGIQPGDFVMPYKSTTRIVAIGGVPPPSGGSGNVVLGFENPAMVVGGQGSLVLFDTKDKQISVGQTLAIYQDINRSASPFIKNDLPDVARNVGIVRIIDNTGVGAVGYVLTIRREIRVGDRAGKG